MMKKKAKIIKVENKLLKKTGYGEISETHVIRAEEVITKNEIDFKKIALPILSRLREVIQQAKSSSHSDDLTSITQYIIQPVMELKANGPMFKFDLIGELSSIMLSFLEHLKQLDEDAIQIIDVHENTLTLIITRDIKGDGGQMGKQLISELENACARYYRRNTIKFR